VNISTAGDAIVTCISCHRAHGSPYYKLLRWDYAGSISTGCAYCHTSKD
jgi:predicted CXXCH cytochrome family protein